MSCSLILISDSSRLSCDLIWAFWCHWSMICMHSYCLWSLLLLQHEWRTFWLLLFSVLGFPLASYSRILRNSTMPFLALTCMYVSNVVSSMLTLALSFLRICACRRYISRHFSSLPRLACFFS